MRTVVVYINLKSAAITSLLGLFGDALVQVMPAVDKARVRRFYDMVKECERRYPVLAKQNLNRDSSEIIRQHLNRVVIQKFGSEQVAAIMRPAIMFRLCTAMCNHGT